VAFLATAIAAYAIFERRATSPPSASD